MMRNTQTAMLVGSDEEEAENEDRLMIAELEKIAPKIMFGHQLQCRHNIENVNRTNVGLLSGPPPPLKRKPAIAGQSNGNTAIGVNEVTLVQSGQHEKHLLNDLLSNSPFKKQLTTDTEDDSNKCFSLTKFDLTKDNDFERFVYDNPRSFVRVILDPVFIQTPKESSIPTMKSLPAVGSCVPQSPSPVKPNKRIRKSPPETSPTDRSQTDMDLSYSPLSPPHDEDERQLQFKPGITISSLASSQGSSNGIAIDVSNRPIPPPRTPSPPPPTTPETDYSRQYSQERPFLSPSLTPPLNHYNWEKNNQHLTSANSSSGNFCFYNVNEDRYNEEPLDEAYDYNSCTRPPPPLPLKVLCDTMPEFYKCPPPFWNVPQLPVVRSPGPMWDEDQYCDDVQEKIYTSPSYRSSSLSPTPVNEEHEVRRKVSRPMLSTKGYPTYFERFLATVFSWNPDWSNRLGTNFGCGGDRIVLPTPFLWLEESIIAIEENGFRFDNFKEFKSTFIPYLLLVLFRDVNAAIYKIVSVPLQQARDMELYAKIKDMFDFKKRQVREKPFLSEVKFVVRTKGSSSIPPLSKGDLLMIRAKANSVYRNLALVIHAGRCTEERPSSSSSSKSGRSRRNGESDEVSYEYSIIIKKTVARKMENETKLVIERITNIEKYLMEAKAIYEIGSGGLHHMNFVRSFICPTNFSNVISVMKSIFDVPHPENYTQKELDAIKLATNFMKVPEEECDRILVLAATSYNSESRRRNLFSELIDAVLKCSNENEKFLVVIGSSHEDKKWLESFKSRMSGLAIKLIEANRKPDKCTLLTRWGALTENTSRNRQYSSRFSDDSEVLVEIRYQIEHSEDFMEELSPREHGLLTDIQELCVKKELEDSKVVVATLDELLSKKQTDLMGNLDFKSCLVFDCDYNDANICSLCSLYKVTNVVILGEERAQVIDGTKETLRVRRKFSPGTFIDRLLESRSTFSF